MLQSEAIVDGRGKSLVRYGAREVLAIVPHDHHLPFSAVKGDAAVEGLLIGVRSAVLLSLLLPPLFSYVFGGNILLKTV